MNTSITFNKDMSIHTIRHPDMIFGQLVRSSIPRGTVTSITLPNLSKDFIVISAQDIPGSNSVRVLDETIPLLSGDHIIYRDQPILAIFGPDQESVHQAVSNVVISYATGDQPLEADQSPAHEVTMHWGDCATLLEQASSIEEHTYLTGNEERTPATPIGVIAVSEGEELTVWATTQWPFHIRNTISEACGLSKRRVSVYQNPYDHTSAGLLVWPSVLAALASIASMKSGKPAKLLSRDPIHRPELIITRKTALDDDMLPVAEKVDLQVHLGVIPLFADEILAQIITGAVPMYHLEACEITARIVTSPAAPRHYYFGFGFPLGLFSTAAHAAHIARRSMVNPANWLMKAVKNSHARPRHLVHLRTALIKELIDQTITRSDFSRKFAVYEMQRSRNRMISTFTGYTRGMGIAAGSGVNGFSNTSMNEYNFSVEVTLDVNDAVRVRTSIIHSKAREIWREAIRSQLGVDPEDIEFSTGSTAGMLDSGPDILDRDLTVIPMLLNRCCESIKNQRFKEPLPITVKRSVKRTNRAATDEGMKAQFSHATWGAMVFELTIDPVSLNPEPIGIWITVSCGRIYDRAALKKKIQSAILRELGSIIGGEARTGLQPAIDIQFHADEESDTADPTPNIIGLLYAAYTSALSQALNEPVTSIPAGAGEVLEFLGGNL